MLRRCFPLLAGLLAVPAALAQTPPASAPAPVAAAAAVAVTGAWARATPPGAEAGAAYVTLEAAAGDRLVSVSTPAAAEAQVHEMRMEGDVMRMRELPGGLPLRAGEAVRLAPGGLHIMLLGLHAPLKQGGTLPLHLVFQSGPPVDIEVPIEAIGASAPPATH